MPRGRRGDRIIDSFRLQRTFKIIKSQLTQHFNVHHWIMSPSAISSCLYNSSRDGNYTNSLGSLFQSLATFSIKNFFLISNINLVINLIINLKINQIGASDRQVAAA